jgi:predicted nucleic acid-binding protein
MNIVDSSGWLEYLSDGPLAVSFEEPLCERDRLIVPTVCIYEVFRVVLREKDEEHALRTAALMRQGQVISLSEGLSLQAARLGNMFKLPMADSIILATAREFEAVIWTMDGDFEPFENVKYFLPHKA